MANNLQPYIGPRPYEREDSPYFFGREREARDLLSLIVAHGEVILHAQSGAGKTSLLNARLIPLLEEKGFEILPSTRVRGLIPQDIQPDEVSNVYVLNSLISWSKDISDPARMKKMTLAEYLKEKSHKLNKNKRPSPRVIIFDQFEELFTFYPERWKEREDFFRQVTEALEDDPLLRVLFVIREDFLANFDPYVNLLPECLRTRYRMECLRHEAACLAVEGPLRDTERSFDKEVASNLVNQLLKIRVKSINGEILESEGEYIEPVQLQVVCRNLWQKLPQDIAVIKAEHVEKFGDIETALREFYEASLRKTIDLIGIKEKDLRNWFSMQIITPAGTRGTVFRGETHTGKISNTAIDILEDQHIIRAEIRAGARWYELTHDRLIEPILESNKDWQQKYQNTLAQRRTIKGIVGLLFVLLIIIGFRWIIQTYEEYNLTTKRIKSLIEQPDDIRQKNTKTVMDGVALYLWNKQTSGSIIKLLEILEESNALIREGYRISDSTKQNLLYLEEITGEWPLTLKYNPDRHLNKANLQIQWQEMAKKLAKDWGIAAPMRLKLVADTTLSTEYLEISYFTYSDQYQQVQMERSAESFSSTIFVPLKPDYILVSETGLPDLLPDVLNNHKNEWARLEISEKEGAYWFVPYWTLPLWNVSRHDALPKESATVLTLAARLLETPEFVLTLESVEYLLDNEGIYHPQTIEEVVKAYGGVDGIRRVLIEIVRQGYPLTKLDYLLDAIAMYPDIPPDSAAKMAIMSQYSIAGNLPRFLPEKRPGANAYIQDLWLFGYEFYDVYEETAPWFPPLKPPIRIYLGRSLKERFITPDDDLVPELKEALTKLRGDIYKQFGIKTPDVKFREQKIGMADNVFRIEFLNQAEDKKQSRLILAQPDNALETLISELYIRYAAYRTNWLTAEDIYWLLNDPSVNDFRNWLYTYYNPTDIRIILRSVIMPNETELNIYDKDGLVEEALAAIAPEQTINDPLWLLSSLVFWINTENHLDVKHITDCLRQTQKARLNPNLEDIPTGPVVNYIERGINSLNEQKYKTAANHFGKAVEIDADLASMAFLALYSPQQQLAMENQSMRLDEICILPEPGMLHSASKPDKQICFELEVFLDSSAASITSERRRKLQLYLLWDYVEEKLHKKAIALQEQLLSQYNRERWTPNEKYFFAYLMLEINKQYIKPPEHIDQIQSLIQSSFRQWTNQQAVAAFEELLSPYTETRAPNWYLSILEPLADIHSKSFWIPCYLAAQFTGVWWNKEDAFKVLDLTDRAESNISKIELHDRARQRAWLDYNRALAFLILIENEYPEPTDEYELHALRLLNNLIEIIPSDKYGWPELDRVYMSLADLYLKTNQIAKADSILYVALDIFPESEPLATQQFLLRLAQLEIDQALNSAVYGLSNPLFNKPDWLCISSFIQLLTREGNYEDVANRFLKTKHSYKDYILMMLYWTYNIERRINEANELLEKRWKSIDQSSWTERLVNGDIKVISEMMIGYYLGKVEAGMIFNPLENKEAFEQSIFGQAGLPFYGLRCEFYFYDALLQDISGNPDDCRKRQLMRLEKVLETEHYAYYEYHMARFLIENPYRWTSKKLK
ncbi:MAG: ATP-binding protein [candidate division Zixibacteria bacterium]|nr:ATP-binding protein [candidate division Zixibacteria bacterium]